MPSTYFMPTTYLLLRSAKAQEQDLNEMDKDYSTLSNLMAEGERADFDTEWLDC